MTREEAVAEAARLSREHPDRATHSWLPREVEPGKWDVAKVGLPGRGPIVNVQEAKPRPPHPDDPRPAHWRNVGGPYGN